MKYDRWTEYKGHDNQEIWDLKEKLMEAERQVIVIENKIKHIQSNCDHQYEFSCSGMYEDSYTCSLCGHETEK